MLLCQKKRLAMIEIQLSMKLKVNGEITSEIDASAPKMVSKAVSHPSLQIRQSTDEKDI